jgi:hypothetical protein
MQGSFARDDGLCDGKPLSKVATCERRRYSEALARTVLGVCTPLKADPRTWLRELRAKIGETVDYSLTRLES